MSQWSMVSDAPLMKLTPLTPCPAGLLPPWICRFLRVTWMPAPLTHTPVVPEARMLLSTPSDPSMVIDLVMVTVPKPPGSRVLMMPPAAVLEIAPAKVLHGAVRLHGL